MVLERSIYSDFVFLEAMYNQGFIRKECELCPLLMGIPPQRPRGGYFVLLHTTFPRRKGAKQAPIVLVILNRYLLSIRLP